MERIVRKFPGKNLKSNERASFMSFWSGLLYDAIYCDCPLMRQQAADLTSDDTVSMYDCLYGPKTN